MKKSYLILAVIVLCFGLVSFGQFEDPVVIFEDSFDDLTQWTDETGAGASLSTDQVWTGDNSVHFLSTAEVENRLLTAVPFVNTNNEKLTFTYYLYDPLGQGGAHAWASGRFGLTIADFDDGVWAGGYQDLIFVGAYHEGSGNLVYRCRVLSSINWADTTVNRSVGWQKMQMELYNGTVNFLINDTLGNSASFVTPTDGYSLRFGSPAGAITSTDFYIDNVIVETSTSVGDWYHY